MEAVLLELVKAHPWVVLCALVMGSLGMFLAGLALALREDVPLAASDVARWLWSMERARWILAGAAGLWLLGAALQVQQQAIAGSAASAFLLRASPEYRQFVGAEPPRAEAPPPELPSPAGSTAPKATTK